MKLPSAVQFAQELGVRSARTIQRLIQKMQDLYGLPIDWDHSRKGYYYMEDVVFLPFLQFSESELVAVYLTQQLGVFENLAPDLYSWIGGFFGDCKVIEPAALKETMRKLHFEGAGP